MLVIRSIICILTFIALATAYEIYENTGYKKTRTSNIVACIAGLLIITYCVLLIATNWNVFTIPKILLFISVCVYIVFRYEWDGDFCAPFWIDIAITFIAYCIAGGIYFNNIEKCEVPDVSITSCTIIYANDTYPIKGSMSGGIWHVQGSVSEESVYKYYYLLEDGGIKQGTIPAESTTIYFIKSGEDAYLETIVTTEYSFNNNETPAKRINNSTKTTYKLYVPEGSIANVYELNAE